MRGTVRVLGLLAVATTMTSAGTLFYGGLEDSPGSSGYERNGDYNDMVWSMDGTLTIGGSGTLIANPAVNETQSMFWDNKSLDGSKMNVGYCLYGGGNCASSMHGTVKTSYLDAWATNTGGQVLDTTFTASGTITATLLAKITAYYAIDELGWYDPANGHWGTIFSGTLTPGTTVSFTPDSTFVLWTDHGNAAQRMYSETNIGYNPSQTHFAFFQDPIPSPEPSTLALLLPGLAVIAFGWRKTTRA